MRPEITLVPLAFLTLKTSILNATIVYKPLDVDASLNQIVGIDLWNGSEHEINAAIYQTTNSNRRFFLVHSIFNDTINFFADSATPLSRGRAPALFAKDQLIGGDTLASKASVSSNQDVNGLWFGGTNGVISGYVGFRGNLAGDTLTGWIKVAVTSDESRTPYRLQILSLAYNSEHDGFIKAGEGTLSGIPESSHMAVGLGLLALGAGRFSRVKKLRDKRDKLV